VAIKDCQFTGTNRSNGTTDPTDRQISLHRVHRTTFALRIWYRGKGQMLSGCSAPFTPWQCKLPFPSCLERSAWPASISTVGFVLEWLGVIWRNERETIFF
jgi:hypothetical protein